MSLNSHDVLVVEDDPELNELVGAYVRIAGFGYQPALNGARAISLARQHPPALIVLDIMLPDLDGFEVCRQLKSSRETAKIPVLMLSALDREEHLQRGAQCGAVDYVVKPFDPERLMKAIKDNAHVGNNGDR